MSGFRPTRASPPAKRAILSTRAGQTTTSDISRSSAVSTSELQGLTPQDIEFLDAVIQRASPSATTFLSVFKAYNDILNERGMDPQNEVNYYGKLLKLGTLKGQSWGDKWRMVKVQQTHEEDPTSEDISVSPSDQRVNRGIPPTPKSRVAARLMPRQRDEDLFTVHSHQDESEMTETEAATEIDVDTPQYHRSPEPVLSRSISEPRAANLINTERFAQPVARRQLIMPTTRNVRPWDQTSDVTDEVRTPSTTPPSYRAAVRDTQDYRHAPVTPRTRTQIERPLSAPGSSKTGPILGQLRERTKSMINEEDAWSKVKMLRDEKEADRFREDKLIERCWEVWRSGFEWILTTNDQISQARDVLLLRTSMQRWRSQTASELDLYSRVTILANNRCLRVALGAWRSRTKEKKQLDWRNDMRNKMKSIREKREITLIKDAWAKWRQSYRSHLSGQHYTERLILQFFQRWKRRLSEVDHLEATGDGFLNVKEHKDVERCWSYWRRAVELRNAEKSIAESVGLRIMGDVMDVWKQRVHHTHVADGFHDHYLKKNMFLSWKRAQTRIRGLENRAVKHLARQDEILLRAIARVWKARERGRLLERVKSVRLVKDAWDAWTKRAHKQKQLEDLALAFSMRSNTSTVSTALLTWRQVHTSHKNALTFAVHYHSVQLRFQMLLTWRLQLRSKLKMIKQGRMAEKFFIARRSWRIWTDMLEAKRREKKLKDLEAKKLRECFIGWLQRATRQRRDRLAEQEIQRRIDLRTAKAALSVWTNRVIDLKLREIDISQQNAIGILTFAFKKWKGVCIRHVEELSLMQSYQDVKREENVRRLFYRWLSAARSVRHRRVTLQRKEDELKASATAATWNKWRERFVDEKLRPIEYDVILQTQRNMLFRAFGIWHSKTKSLPAIRFHASHEKSKYWEIWRAAMPQALRARKAREKDKRTLLTKTMDKWLQGYRTKIALKAVARARYLRLPTSAPRLATSLSRSPAESTQTPSRRAFHGRPTQTEDKVIDGSEAGPSRSNSIQPQISSRPFAARTGIISLLSSRPRSDSATNVTRPKYHSPRTLDPSPTRTKSSFALPSDDTPLRTKLPARRLREPSPAPSRSSFDPSRKKQSRGRHESPTRGVSQPPSSNGDVMNRTNLWLELREVRMKSRPPTERSGSREPP